MSLRVSVKSIFLVPFPIVTTSMSSGALIVIFAFAVIEKYGLINSNVPVATFNLRK